MFQEFAGKRGDLNQLREIKDQVFERLGKVNKVPCHRDLSKQSGQRCKNFATKGKRVCLIHGGKSTGPKTDEGKERQKMAPWKHGRSSKEAKEEQKAVRILIRVSKALIRV